MKLAAAYSTDMYFTLGELRSLVAQQKELPDEVLIKLKGDHKNESGDDMIVLEWDEA